MATVSTSEKAAPRNDRHVIVGLVVSDKAAKTRVVSVIRSTRHARYEKVIRKRVKFYVHDEKNESHTGDTVEIMGSRPLSRLKRWRLVRVVKAGVRIASDVTEGAQG
ncbi:MAG: 30S ribosomal protein S17 [Elusimicrobia bacterium GWA2_69_24]|nr:MAG: 30S ribosomal protein S17 [Elusimicrobia bacterium GWA2_69_24]HBL15690.1 30S ribosomal protein S17 [Elusimicrobiota bacterium]